MNRRKISESDILPLQEYVKQRVERRRVSPSVTRLELPLARDDRQQAR